MTTTSGYIFVDLETGGLEPQINPILQIAAIVTDSVFDIRSYFMSYVRPPGELELTDEALAVNGLKRSDVEKAPEEKFVAEAYASFVRSAGSVRFAGYNCPFDLSFLDAMLSRYKTPSLGYKLPWFDIYAEAKRRIKLSSYKLVNVCKHFDIKLNGAHDGMVDVYATLQIARRLYVETNGEINANYK